MAESDRRRFRYTSFDPGFIVALFMLLVFDWYGSRRGQPEETHVDSSTN